MANKRNTSNGRETDTNTERDPTMNGQRSGFDAVDERANEFEGTNNTPEVGRLGGEAQQDRTTDQNRNIDSEGVGAYDDDPTPSGDTLRGNTQEEDDLI